MEDWQLDNAIEELRVKLMRIIGAIILSGGILGVSLYLIWRWLF